jgi:hypothetical protein
MLFRYFIFTLPFHSDTPDIVSKYIVYSTPACFANTFSDWNMTVIETCSLLNSPRNYLCRSSNARSQIRHEKKHLLFLSSSSPSPPPPPPPPPHPSPIPCLHLLLFLLLLFLLVFLNKNNGFESSLSR